MKCTFSLACVVLCLAGAVRGAEPISTEQVASQLMAATVTVRISHVAALDQEEAERRGGAVQPQGEGSSVAVCSGVSLGNRLLVTALGDETFRSFAGRAAAGEKNETARVRVTLSDGRQAVAWPRVVDEYSSLGLFEAEGVELPTLELAEALPAVGAPVLAASAAGIERPVVSQGIVSGIDRALAGYSLPPLLQCDVRTTETTGGAALVDRSGRLIGVIAAVAGADNAGGWTYAVPVRHVARLVAARQGEELVILKRQRPSLGLRLGAGAADGSVVVEHVEPEGPAARAGLAAGDVVVETDGRRIRSAYQAVMLVLRKQPGDGVEFLIDRGGEMRRVAVVLGGAADGSVLAVPGLNLVRIGPQLNARVRGGGQIEVENQARVEELGAAAGEPGAEADALALLRRQVEAFTQVIRQLQDELARRDEAAAKQAGQVEALRKEIEKLRGELEAAREGRR